MNEISYYNPLKTYKTKEHILSINEVIKHYSRVCFLGDEIGYFFCPLRRVGRPSISFESEMHYNFFAAIKSDPTLIKYMFQRYKALFKYELIEHFEKQVFVEKDPALKCFMLMCLTNISDNTDSTLSNFNQDNTNLLLDSIDKINNFYIAENELYFREVPEDSIIISYRKSFENNEGILITEKELDKRKINQIDNLNYYYVEKK